LDCLSHSTGEQINNRLRETRPGAAEFAWVGQQGSVGVERIEGWNVRNAHGFMWLLALKLLGCD
jgi:hypothetical protein